MMRLTREEFERRKEAVLDGVAGAENESAVEREGGAAAADDPPEPVVGALASLTYAVVLVAEVGFELLEELRR